MKTLARIGEVIDDDYTVVRLIGRGSMADVFEAETTQGERIALKILRNQVGADSVEVKRLEREASAQSRIDSNHVAKIFGAGLTTERRPYLVVELLRGRSLREVVRKGAVASVSAASYAWQALQGLNAAHQAGVIHRDLKPANLMLEDSNGPVERVVVIDFGFASLEGAARLTAQGTIVGSLSYIAPERFSGQPGGPLADLYSVGIILYELVTGKKPFSAESDLALMQMQLHTVPPSPMEVAPTLAISRALSSIIMKALAKDPRHRYSSAEDMAAELDRAIQGDDLEKTP